ncbi:SDR family oxidoreductase [Corallococcus macrosporus]|uniref:SDR family oxidoreductase n=1 Tax=Corallococcus macrosporus TaxID=35 RepID=A0ABS3DEF4_9BACT|nr:SDR family oxidoreductase [Corallococcus macrosporus]MBN8229366.1 SDR family oxidoreductase [Corallococcus macrosporus]
MILVTGATGNIGREVVARLSAEGVPLRVVTRDAKRVAALPPGIERVVGDLRDRATVEQAVRGVRRLFLVSPMDDVEGRAEAVLVEEARRAGVTHVVKLSSLGTGNSGIAGKHRDSEQRLRDSGMAWTFVRPGMFMSNALQWAGNVKAGTPIFTPTASGRMAPIDPRDIAEVAALALTRDGHEGQAYALTGEELLSAHDQVAILSRVLGRPLRCVDVPVEGALANVRKAGMPSWLVEGLGELWAAVRSGKGEVTTPEVARLTGHAPGTFEAWARRHRDAFA